MTRITGAGATRTQLNIFEHSFEDLKQCALWVKLYESSLKPCKTCLECDYIQACGGGFLPHRYSAKNGFDNPSVYCEDLKAIFRHIWNRAAPQVSIASSGGSMLASLSDIRQ